MDYCSPVYCGLLNAAQSDKLESVQRLSVAVIMGVGATSYREGLVVLGLPTLEQRRLYMTKVFALKCYSNPRFSIWFKPHPPPARVTRQAIPRFQVPGFRTKRADGSPLAYYTKLLNGLSEHEFNTRVVTKPLST